MSVAPSAITSLKFGKPSNLNYENKGVPKSEIPEQAEAQAQYVVANDWLIEKWGTHHDCRECGNIEWTVSTVFPAIPSGFFSFLVTCRFCGNTLQLIPGHADLDEPHRAWQMQFPAPEQ